MQRRAVKYAGEKGEREYSVCPIRTGPPDSMAAKVREDLESPPGHTDESAKSEACSMCGANICLLPLYPLLLIVCLLSGQVRNSTSFTNLWPFHGTGRG